MATAGHLSIYRSFSQPNSKWYYLSVFDILFQSIPAFVSTFGILNKDTVLFGLQFLFVKLGKTWKLAKKSRLKTTERP